MGLQRRTKQDFSGTIPILENREVQSAVAFGGLRTVKGLREPLRLLKMFYVLTWIMVEGVENPTDRGAWRATQSRGSKGVGHE